MRLRLGAGWASALTGAGLGALALGPGIRRGYLLSYDMVFVPRLPLRASLLGFGGSPPRAVPSDLIVALLSRVLPADIVQKLLLLTVFVLACSGAAALLADQHWVARLTAGICYTWNPYVAERLILGQWALLLGYAGLPWVVKAFSGPAASLRRTAGRLIAALIPAAVGGFAPMSVSAILAGCTAIAAPADSAGTRIRRTAVALSVVVLLSLPWLIPALGGAVRTSPAGVAAFAARADTPFGAFGSVLLLGGTWNGQVVPAGYGGPATVVWLAVVLIALAGFVRFGRAKWPGLGPAALIGLAIAGLGTFSAGRAALRGLIGLWPGFAVLRDGQQFVAPLALAEAMGAGLVVAWVTSRLIKRGDVLRQVGWPAAAVALILPVVLLPGLAWGAADRLRPVWYPRDWLAAGRLIDSAPAGGKVLLLPWAAYRRPRWNNYEAVLDPWPRLLGRTVVWNDAVQVGRITVPAEDPLAARLGGLVSSDRPLTGALRAAGISFVIVDAGSGPAGPTASYARRLTGSRVVFARPGLVVYEVGASGP